MKISNLKVGQVYDCPSGNKRTVYAVLDDCIVMLHQTSNGSCYAAFDKKDRPDWVLVVPKKRGWTYMIQLPNWTPPSSGLTLCSKIYDTKEECENYINGFTKHSNYAKFSEPFYIEANLPEE